MSGIKIKSRLLLGLVSAKADLTKAKLVFYHGPTFSDSATYDLKDALNILRSNKFSKEKKTVLYIHGYLENLEVESISVIVNAYLQRNDVNLLVLDWGELADGSYLFDAVINAKQLGPKLAQKLVEMFNNGLNNNTFHIVGHSLGSQMGGIIGREVSRITNKEKTIKRITALDAAFPLFYTGFTAHLSETDADFVDAIHTDSWLYGTPFRTATADFWPNNGKTLQPGCPKRNYKMLSDNDLASHRRSWWFWAESVTNQYDDKFDAVPVKNWNDFKTGNLDPHRGKAVMGHDCPTNIKGDYYLQTNGKSPYARGSAGTTYIHPAKLPGNTPEDIEKVTAEFQRLNSK